MSSHPVRHVVKQTTPQRSTILEAKQRKNSVTELEDRSVRARVNDKTLKPKQMGVSRLPSQL